jgi:putative redox protein
MNRSLSIQTTSTRYVEEILIGKHKLLADEPVDAGGTDAGPGPYEYLLTALGACTGITLRMFADRRRWPLEAVRIVLSHFKVHAEDCVACEHEPRLMDRIEVEIDLKGELSADQRQRLLQVAGKCPVHNTLAPAIDIQTRLAVASP